MSMDCVRLITIRRTRGCAAVISSPELVCVINKRICAQRYVRQREVRCAQDYVRKCAHCDHPMELTKMPRAQVLGVIHGL